MLLKSIIIIPILWIVADTARILVILPYPAYSHQLSFRPITIELLRRGHQLIVFTMSPMKNATLQNCTEVELHYTETMDNFDFYSLAKTGIWKLLKKLQSNCEVHTEYILSHPALQRIISPNNTEKIDLVIIQSMFYNALYALSIRLNAPLIGFTSMPLISWDFYNFGNPPSLAYSPSLQSSYSDNMNLWERIGNLYSYYSLLFFYQYMLMPIQERVSRKHFGDSVPPAHQLASYMNLLLANFHPYIYPRANVPEIIPIGGYRIKYEKKPLPHDLEKMLNDTEQEYIYFSLGSNLKSNILPVERRNMLLRTFAKLPYKILWKFESANLTDKPDNVIIRKWFPQQEVLAHPNIRLFIYQAGLQSTEEAIRNGVPVIGFPMFTDQFYNIRCIQSRGAGKMLSLINVNEDEFEETILEVMKNPSYKENMVKLRDLLQDLPYDPLDNAVWWIEHVIRHKGAPHLRNKSRDMPFYKVLLLDVIAILLGAVILIVFILITIMRCLYNISRRFLPRVKTKSVHSTKKKQ